MIEELVPATVATVATRADLSTNLFAEEVRALGPAVDARRRDFETGRECARRALAQLGIAAAPIGSGTRGEPLWPANIVGSITHCASYRACAVARSIDVLAVGIDAEPDAPLPAGVLATVAGEEEQRALAAPGAGAGWDRVLFSAKESVFKAWFPLTGDALAFEDAEVRIGDDGTFTARVRGEELRGRWRACAGIVATAVVIAR